MIPFRRFQKGSLAEQLDVSAPVFQYFDEDLPARHGEGQVHALNTCSVLLLDIERRSHHPKL
jgi:hypothetical protein